MTTGNGWDKDKALVEFQLLDNKNQIEKIFSVLWDMKAEMAEFKATIAEHKTKVALICTACSIACSGLVAFFIKRF